MKEKEKEMLDKWLDTIMWARTRKIVHRGYSATERQIGTIYEGWRIIKRRRIPQCLRWLYDGKNWAFIGESSRLGPYA